MRREQNRSDAGFTLIEMLIALAIFSLLSIGATTAMLGGLKTKEDVKIKLDHITEFEMARALMRSDLNSLVLRENRDPYGNAEQYIVSGGVETIFTFTRSGRENPGGLERRGPVERIAYVFEDDKLIRRSFASANPAPQTKLRDRILLTNLENVRVSFEDDTLSFSQLYVPGGEKILPVNMMVLTLVYPGGVELEQKFELSP